MEFPHVDLARKDGGGARENRERHGAGHRVCRGVRHGCTETGQGSLDEATYHGFVINRAGGLIVIPDDRDANRSYRKLPVGHTPLHRWMITLCQQ